MKTLILVRHAKSSWDDAGMKDFDRPLNGRGKKDAPEMAGRLREKDISIDLFVSSPAKRARKTARIFAEAFKKEKEDVRLIDELYLATASAFEKVISDLDDKYNRVVIFSHNPGITEFASSLTDVRVDNMPTCAMFGVSVDAKSWSEFETAQKNFLFFDYPKNPDS